MTRQSIGTLSFWFRTLQVFRLLDLGVTGMGGIVAMAADADAPGDATGEAGVGGNACFLWDDQGSNLWRMGGDGALFV